MPYGNSGTQVSEHVAEASALPATSHGPSLPDLIEEQVRRTPDRIAVSDAAGDYSYARLWEASGRIAARLLAHGAVRGELVGICVPRSREMAAIALGVLRAGAAYVPLDAAFPDRRLRTMLERAQIRSVVTLTGYALPAAIADHDAVLIAIGDDGAPEGGEQPALPVVDGADLAYVLFTSGSTGEPKGVRTLHSNLVNFMRSMHHSPGFAESDVICAVTTWSFDIAALELYLPLMAGGRVHVASEAELGDPEATMSLVQRSGSTVLQTTPTRLRLLCDEGRAARLAGLKLLVGGEAMPRDLANEVVGRCRELWNMYGPTETTIWSTIERIEAGNGPVPLGRPIANTRIHVLDEADRPVADGQRGEIWIGGDGVADGYLHRTDLTAERFRVDPFAADGSRMYRTGDIGNVRDGVLHFHGRADDQVKLRGYRIELGDIEAAALEDPLVRDAAAALRDFGNGSQRLVLYVVPRDEHGDPAARLRDHLREALPAYMRPSHIVVLERMPATPNGKIDRKALPMPADRGVHAAAAAETPRDARIAYLAALWCELIGIDEARVDDNFFDLGGDSLLAVNMIARVERDTGRRLNVLAIATDTLGSVAGMLPSEGVAKRRDWISRLRGLFGG